MYFYGDEEVEGIASMNWCQNLPTHYLILTSFVLLKGLISIHRLKAEKFVMHVLVGSSL